MLDGWFARRCVQHVHDAIEDDAFGDLERSCIELANQSGLLAARRSRART